MVAAKGVCFGPIFIDLKKKWVWRHQSIKAILMSIFYSTIIHTDVINVRIFFFSVEMLIDEKKKESEIWRHKT